MKRLAILGLTIISLTGCVTTTANRTRIDRYGDECWFTEDVDRNNDFDINSTSGPYACPDKLEAVTP